MGKAFMFMVFVWLVVITAGGVMQGSVAIAATELTADITAADTTITVASTNGFPGTGIIQIGNERIAYADTTATTFRGRRRVALRRCGMPVSRCICSLRSLVPIPTPSWTWWPRQPAREALNIRA